MDAGRSRPASICPAHCCGTRNDELSIADLFNPNKHRPCGHAGNSTGTGSRWIAEASAVLALWARSVLIAGLAALFRCRMREAQPGRKAARTSIRSDSHKFDYGESPQVKRARSSLSCRRRSRDAFCRCGLRNQRTDSVAQNRQISVYRRAKIQAWPLLGQSRYPGVSFSILAWSRSC